MHSFRKYPKIFKYTCLATISIGAGWIYNQVKTTKNIFANAIDADILNIAEPTVSPRDESGEFFLIEFPSDHTSQHVTLFNIWKTLKFTFAQRLLILAHSENKYIRKKAIRQLATIKNLESWQYAQLGSMMDAVTAVGLARTPEVDQRLFLPPPVKYLDHTHDMIHHVMKDLLVNLHTKSQHPCMGYFISKAFADDDEDTYSDYSSFELKKYILSNEDFIPPCLESLLHHASVKNYAKDIATLNGLPLLMEIYHRYKDNLDVTATICRIISYLSMHGDLLDELYQTGWITVLAEWVRHNDVRISIPAAKALANLDPDENSLYLQRLYLLHPSHRVARDAGVDVIFVHGLLGGVFFTWRQRSRNEVPPGFFGKRRRPESLMQGTTICKNKECKAKVPKFSDPDMEQFMQDYHIYCNICQDYDVLWEDIPVNANVEDAGIFCTTGRKLDQLRKTEDECFTNCWPRDWLADDCDDLRIIGVNYETNLSMWTPICPVEKVKSLEERSEELIEQLLQIEVGKRPIVWVTHSMGGLIIKCLLNKASKSQDPNVNEMYLNTKGMIFYSTPHIGSRVANISQITSLLIWPSLEVQELKRDSEHLINIHEEFLELNKSHPMKIVTFVETEPTVLSVSAVKFKFQLVEPDSGNTGIGEYFEIPLDHLGICKPASRYSFLYQKVLNLIQDILYDSNHTVGPEL